MARRKDGSVVMPPMSYAIQAATFAAFVAGYALGAGVDLWSLTAADSFSIDNPLAGTRSHRIYRAGLLDGPTLHHATVALLDSIATWPRATPLGDLPPDAELFGEKAP